MKKIGLLTMLVVAWYSSQAQQSSEVKVKIENIKHFEGSIKIALYNQEDHFLSKEIASDGKSIVDSNLEFTFDGLPGGTYAISVFHDENDNGKLDTNLIGIPKEPYAFSNNAKGMFGPPSFEDCKFVVESPVHELVIQF